MSLHVVQRYEYCSLKALRFVVWKSHFLHMIVLFPTVLLEDISFAHLLSESEHKLCRRLRQLRILKLTTIETSYDMVRAEPLLLTHDIFKSILQGEIL